jgi:mannosyltransferase OCH1-like enzyme
MKTKIWKVWIGGDEIPEHFKQYTDTWSKISDAEIIEVTDANVKEWTGKTSYELADHFKGNKQVANHWVRYFLMYYYGGIYLDLDVEVIKDSDIWKIDNPTFGFESKGWVNNHVMISNRNFKNVFEDLMDFTSMFHDVFKNPEINTGPGLVTKYFDSYFPYFNVLPPEYFSPWNWNEKPDRTRITENTLAVHHFAHSWKK